MITANMGRRSLRRLYNEIDNECARLAEALYRVDDPGQRSTLLLQRASNEGLLAQYHTDAYGPSPIAEEGGRPMAESLRASAELFRLVAATESAVASATWRAAESLVTGSAFFHAHGWVAVQRVDPDPDVPGLLNVQVTVHQLGPDPDMPGRPRDQVVVLGIGERVRVYGPHEPIVAVVDLAREAGASWEESREWLELAVTADREHRAALLLTLSELAGGRVGAQAAEVLVDLAQAEDTVADRTAGQAGGGQPVAFPPPRWSIAAVFAGLGAAVMLPELTAISPLAVLLLVITTSWPAAVLLTAGSVGRRDQLSTRLTIAALLTCIAAVVGLITT